MFLVFQHNTFCTYDTTTVIIKPTWLRVSSVEGRRGSEEPLRRGILAFQVSLKHWQSSSCPGFHATGQFVTHNIFTWPFSLESPNIPAMTCVRMKTLSLTSCLFTLSHCCHLTSPAYSLYFRPIPRCHHPWLWGAT